MEPSTKRQRTENAVVSYDHPPKSAQLFSTNGVLSRSLEQPEYMDEPYVPEADQLGSQWEELYLNSELPMSILSPGSEYYYNFGFDLPAESMSPLTTPSNGFVETFPNPFNDVDGLVVPARPLPVQMPIGGYIKLNAMPRGRMPVPKIHNNLPRRPAAFQQTPRQVNSMIPASPPNLGQSLKLDDLDSRLYKFYSVGFCSGRTLLDSTNSWKNDLLPMMEGSEIVRTTVLALAGIYLYEYMNHSGIRDRATQHYRHAVKLLDQELNNAIFWTTGGCDDLIGAIALLNMRDVVTYELRRPKHRVPRWLEGARIASQVLDRTDLGHRYRKAYTVQEDKARISNATVIARAAIFALPLTPLNRSNTRGKFGWLLHGDERDQTRIHGASGLSPKLLYMWSQATHYCAAMDESPNSSVWTRAAQNILDRLKNFSQWSELSGDRASQSLEQLRRECQVFPNGEGKYARVMTDFGGHAWVAALKIYVLCRFYRYPRHHPEVISVMNDLYSCIKPMPKKGDYFTAQIPLLPIFFLGLLSVRDKHRSLASNWFTEVLENRHRSSVIPLWPDLQDIWQWIDEVVSPGDGNSEIEHIYDRNPWWEMMVDQIVEEKGTLCLI